MIAYMAEGIGGALRAAAIVYVVVGVALGTFVGWWFL